MWKFRRNLAISALILSLSSIGISRFTNGQSREIEVIPDIGSLLFRSVSNGMSLHRNLRFDAPDYSPGIVIGPYNQLIYVADAQFETIIRSIDLNSYAVRQVYRNDRSLKPKSEFGEIWRVEISQDNNGNLFVFETLEPLNLADNHSTKLTKINMGDYSSEEFILNSSILSPVVSPDGKKIAFSHKNFPSTLSIYDIETNEVMFAITTESKEVFWVNDNQIVVPSEVMGEYRLDLTDIYTGEHLMLGLPYEGQGLEIIEADFENNFVLMSYYTNVAEGKKAYKQFDLQRNESSNLVGITQQYQFILSKKNYEVVGYENGQFIIARGREMDKLSDFRRFGVFGGINTEIIVDVDKTQPIENIAYINENIGFDVISID